MTTDNQQRKPRTHILAIDETGAFRIDTDENGIFKYENNRTSNSFVCAVSIGVENVEDLEDAYKKLYQKFLPGENLPKKKITNSDKNSENFDSKQYFLEYQAYQRALLNCNGEPLFHYCKLSNKFIKEDFKHFRNILMSLNDVLMPYVNKVYVSKGKPILFANNQSWWLMAVVVVIKEFLKDLETEKGDIVKVIFDSRAERVCGLAIEKDSNNNSESNPQVDFKKYHDLIKKQITEYFNDEATQKGIKLEVYYGNDTSDFFINLADIVCGFVRDKYNLRKKALVDIKFTECPCKLYIDEESPEIYVKDNPFRAVNIITREVANDRYDNLKLLPDIFNALRKDEAYDYIPTWNMFYYFVKNEIKERSTNSSLVKIKPFVEKFFEEFANACDYLPNSSYIELMLLFNEYNSHIGDVDIPFKRDIFIKYLKSTDKNSETRILRKMEKMISFTLRECQMFFNKYDFNSAINNLENMCRMHSKINEVLKDEFSERDEHTTALLGSLAQSYAYKGDFDTAIEYFRMSKDYSVRTTNISDSYLFTIYHRNKDVESARMQFKLQVGKNPEEYYEAKKYDDVWKLLSYCKLRALELYVNGKTELPAIEQLDNCNTEYPFPLVMKWEGIALYLENKEENKDKVEKYFKDAIENLLNENNGFAIKTLALPIMQCYSYIDNKNVFHAEYKTKIEELKKQSPYFSKYVDEEMPPLNEIKNDKSFWERAMMLPFIYS